MYKFRILVPVLVFSSLLFSHAQTKDEEVGPSRFEDAVAFEYTLSSLSSMISSGRFNLIPKDKIVMVTATISSRQLINPEEANYLGILELASGEWKDGEDLDMHYGYVQLRGPRFAGTIPEPRSRTQSPKEIPLHSHVLIVGYYLGYGEDEMGGRFPVLEAVDFRILQR